MDYVEKSSFSKPKEQYLMNCILSQRKKTNKKKITKIQYPRSFNWLMIH